MKKASKKGKEKLWCLVFSKKKSLVSTKYTILKSKKPLKGHFRHGHGHNKSQHVSPKRKNNLYNYSQVSHQEVKPKITMNVSIDLSQNQNQKVILIDNN